MVSAIFSKISLGTPSALAGLNRLRQRQYATQNGVAAKRPDGKNH
jgi:hypothetical protein